MAESTLSLNHTDFSLAVAHFLGFGLTAGNWTADQLVLIDMAIQSGLRQFYYPPKIDNGEPYQWTFLRPVGSLTTIDTYSTGTVSIGQYDTGTVTVATGLATLVGGVWPSWMDSGDTLTIGETVYVITTRDGDTTATVVGADVGTATAFTLVSGAASETKVILGGGTWPTWAITHGTLTIGSTEFPISVRDSDTELTLTTAVTTQQLDQTYTLTHNGNYDMDDDFGGIQGTLTYNSSDNRDDIKIVGENNIRSLRSTTSTRAAPQYVAFRPKETTGVTGQRWEAQFYPIPDSEYPLEFRFTAYIYKLDATNKFPFGGMAHGETIKQSILAAAEAQEDDNPTGPQYQKFIALLTASIGEDSKATTKRYFGQNLDRSGMHEETLTRSNLRHISNATITYPTGTRS